MCVCACVGVCAAMHVCVRVCACVSSCQLKFRRQGFDSSGSITRKEMTTVAVLSAATHHIPLIRAFLFCDIYKTTLLIPNIPDVRKRKEINLTTVSTQHIDAPCFALRLSVLYKITLVSPLNSKD